MRFLKIYNLHLKLFFYSREKRRKKLKKERKKKREINKILIKFEL